MSYSESALKVAIVGFGTVGSAVARILCNGLNQPLLRLTHIFNRNVERKKVDWVPGRVRWCENIEEVLASDIDVMVEVVGGVNPAGEWVKRALASGKSVVTANKQLIAQCGTELAEVALRAGQHLAFGASVAGGVPVLSGLQDGLAGDRLYKIHGVLNGTCNYILTKIESTGIPFAQALKEAQEAGFAEADPTDDIDGYDARAKLVILSRVGLRAEVRPEQVACHSIRPVEMMDFAYAHDLYLRSTVRQIARAELRDGTLYASVQPAILRRDSPLAQLEGGQNLVVSTGVYGGETVFSGHGAGGNPTAVAVVSDLVAVSRNRSQGLENLSGGATSALPVSHDFTTPHYVRFTVRDRPGIIAALASAFSNHGINIEAVLQRPDCAKAALPFVITLEECSTSRMESALHEIGKFDFLTQPPLHLPILS